MESLLLFAALALVALWTARLARSKGRNPWLWGGASLILGIPSVHLFAVVPLVFLMFVKSLQQQSRSIPQTTNCSKCHASPARNSRYCTNCGWELSRLYVSDKPDEAVQPVNATSTEEQEPAKVSNAAEQGPRDQGAAPPVAVTAGEPAQNPVQEAPASTAPVYRKVVPVDAPTAAGMTERGVRLFNQSRIQESIDQFTKAIALDSNYIQAWAKRAEAYALLGRGAEAAEDRRRLESLNASSSSG